MKYEHRWRFISFFNIFRASVRLGEYDTNSDPDCSTSGFCAPTVINHMISHVVIHPGKALKFKQRLIIHISTWKYYFNPTDYKHGHYHHDIALVILKTPLNYTGKQWKVKLNWNDKSDVAVRLKSDSVKLKILEMIDPANIINERQWLNEWMIL